MVRYFIVLILLISCQKNSTSNTEKEELNLFFENFVKIKNKDYNFENVNYINYGNNNHAFKRWIEESKVDTNYLKINFNFKKIDLENAVLNINPKIFNNYKKFNDKDFYNYKLKHPNSNFNEYFATNYNRCELLTIDFIVFNEERNKLLIYHSLDCTSGFVEVYSKNNNKWILYKEICRTSD